MEPDCMAAWGYSGEGLLFENGNSGSDAFAAYHYKMTRRS